MTEQSCGIRWAEEAVHDLEEIVAHVAVDSPINAKKLLERLRSRANALETTPLRGRVVPELAQFGTHSWRELIVKPYRLIYRPTADEVYVLAVLDGRRDLEELLLERLVRGRRR